jgi:hypothetical protein
VPFIRFILVSILLFVVEIRHPYKYIQESRFSARVSRGWMTRPLCQGQWQLGGISGGDFKLE